MKYKFKAFVAPIIFIFLVYVLKSLMHVIMSKFCLNEPCIQSHEVIPMVIFVKFIPMVFFYLCIIFIFINILRWLKIKNLKKNEADNIFIISNNENTIRKQAKTLKIIFIFVILTILIGYSLYELHLIDRIKDRLIPCNSVPGVFDTRIRCLK